MARKITLTVLVIISYFVQTTFNHGISIGNIKPNLLIILVCSFALLRGRKEGLILGFFAGLLMDIFYGYADVIGLYALIYMYLGYMVGFFHDVIYTDDLIVTIVFIFGSDIVCNFIVYFIAFALRNKLDFGIYFRNVILPEAIYTVFLGVFLYKLFKVINDKLEESEKRKENRYDSRDITDII